MSTAAPAGGAQPQFTLRRARKFLTRALALRCPHCGQSPLFLPLRQTRSLRDWFTPLDGCPRCGYPYEREIGYFLLATWAVGYGFSGILGVGLYLLLEFTVDLSTPALLTAVIIPPVIFSILFARHSKALFLAFDQFFDPPVPFREDEEGGGGGGESPANPVDPRPTRPLHDASKPR